MIGFRQQGGITLQRRGEREREREIIESYDKDASRQGEMEETLTDMCVSLLRMTWRRWGGSMGGALRCSSGLQMYCSCPYRPGGELDRSARPQMITQTDSALLFLLKVTLFDWLTWCVWALQRVDLQRVKHLKVWLLHLYQVIDGTELTGHSWLQNRQSIHNPRKRCGNYWQALGSDRNMNSSKQ